MIDSCRLSIAYIWIENSYDVDSAWEALNEYFELSKRVLESLLDGKSIHEDDVNFLNWRYPNSSSTVNAALENLQKANDDLDNFIEMGKVILKVNGHPFYILGDGNEKN